MAITWANIKFSQPQKLDAWEPTYRAGLYVIMTNANEKDLYRILYVGESSNFSERGFPQGHHKYKCWDKNKNTTLYVSVYNMPDSSPEERRELEQKVIDTYKDKLLCNGN